MLGEITHLQGIIDDLVVLTAEPHKLPPASEQVSVWGPWGYGRQVLPGGLQPLLAAGDQGPEGL